MNCSSIIFDIGGVILRWAPHEFIERFTDDAGLQEKLRNRIADHPDWLEMDRGRLNIETLTQRIIQNSDIPPDAVNRYLLEVIDSMVPIPESINLLNDAVKAGYQAFVLSNMSSDSARILKSRFDFWRLFSGIVFSCDVNMIKPDPGIFEYVLNRFSLKPAETIFIDDTALNTEAAEKLGIASIRFTDAQSARARLIEMGCTIPA